jgi:hypothetical protein
MTQYASTVKVDVATKTLADNDPVTTTSELTNATADINPVKVNVETNKLANNDPVHQTGALEKAQLNAMNGKVIFQISLSTNGEPTATAVTNIAFNSVSTS